MGEGRRRARLGQPAASPRQDRPVRRPRAARRSCHALLWETAAPWRPAANLTAPDTAQRLSAGHLHGLVELRALVEGRQSFWGFMAGHPAWQTPQHPYRVAVEIRSVRTGAIVVRRVSFQSDELPQTPYLVHYAPGTVQNASMAECLSLPPKSRCSATYWFRPFSRFEHEYWDTRRMPHGAYDVTVYAWDITGDMTRRTVRVEVANL